MSGKYSGLHKIQDVAPHAYYVHRRAPHNLNLVLKDTMEAVTETRPFYHIIESVYNYGLCGGKSFRMTMIVLAQILH